MSGARRPLIQLTCEHATSRVAGETASASCSNGTARTAMPRWARAAASGPVKPGCSSSEVRISSPGRRSRPVSTRTMPSLVQVVSAMSSGSAFSSAA